MMLTPTKDQKILDLVNQLVSGTHDPMPTRLLYASDTDCGRLDAWWQEYFLSAHNARRQIALELLELIQNA